MANKRDYVGVCAVIDRALEGRPSDRTSRPVLEAVEKLTTTVAATSRGSVGNAKWKPSRLFNKKDNGDAIAGGEHDPIGATQALKMALLMSNNTMLSDLRHDTLAALECIGQSQRSPQTSAHDGELPPPAPRAFFGRGELVDKVVGFAQNLQHFALIGAAGIGKTSIALKVLHDDRVSKRFGSNRRFIRCDQFPASCPHFLARLSEVIGAGIENPKDMTPLRPRLSSEDMFIVLDNAESLLDPQATNHQEIYAAVHELFQFENIWLCITSRITTTPRYCERLYVPPLSKEAACNIFYGIYSDGERSVTIDDLLRRLDFHALSITVLATAAVENTWNSERLANQWEEQRAQVLRTDHHESFAATIELSLASPTFCSLGPTARDLLGVVAFFPQGIEEKNLDWLFPTIPDRRRIFDKFCVLSLTYRCNGFITMLAPIRDYLCPREPKSSPLLCATKDSYFTRLSAGSNTNEPRLKETRWIVSEDVNVEHLLDVFASTDGDEVSWNACIDFINHLHRQKPRQTVLRSKIEGLSDDHPSKAQCLFMLSRLSGSVGNKAEQRRLLTHVLKIRRQQGDDRLVAQTLRFLSRTGSPEEGIQQTKEALGLFERLGDTVEQAKSWGALAWLLLQDGQLAAAEGSALREIELLQGKGENFTLYRTHCLLGQIYHSRKEKKEAIHQFETALKFVSRCKSGGAPFWIYYFMAVLFCDEDEFDKANANIELAKSHTGQDEYKLGRGTHMRAFILYRQRRLREASSEARDALEIFKRLGAAKDAVECEKNLRDIEEAVGSQLTTGPDSVVPTHRKNLEGLILSIGRKFAPEHTIVRFIFEAIIHRTTRHVMEIALSVVFLLFAIIMHHVFC